MKLGKRIVSLVATLFVSALASCDFSPMSPFTGFDEQGSRLTGTFQSNGSSGTALGAAPSTAYDGITVYVEQDSSVRTVVKSNGTFTLVGLPQGTIAVVFERDDDVIGRLVFQDVVPNQELRIVVLLNASGDVELVEEDRDNVGLGECARGAGFWCQNRTGKNPNMTRSDFESYAQGALDTLKEARVAGMEDIRAVEDAVCNTGNQLLRQLTSVLLNLEAGLLDPGTALIGEDYADVEEVVQAALDALAAGKSRTETNAIKDVLDRINNNANTEGECEPTEDNNGEEENEEEDGNPVEIPSACHGSVSDNGKKVTICHKQKNTLSVSINALPAHLGHGDTCGTCQ